MNYLIYFFGCSLILVLSVTNAIDFFGTDKVRFDIEIIENNKPDSFWIWNLNIVTINDSHVSVSFNATLDRNFDNSLTLLLEFYQWTSNNDWKRVIRLNKKKACGFLRNVGGDLFTQIAKEIGVADPKCPIPKHFYFLENRLVDVQSTVLGKFLIGKFKAVAKGFTSKKEVLFDGKGSFTTSKI